MLEKARFELQIIALIQNLKNTLNQDSKKKIEHTDVTQKQEYETHKSQSSMYLLAI